MSHTEPLPAAETANAADAVVEAPLPLDPALVAKIKDIVSPIAGNIDPNNIGDDTSFRDELGLDSLGSLEVGVDLDYEFKLGLPENDLNQIDTVREAVNVVLKCYAEREAAWNVSAS